MTFPKYDAARPIIAIDTETSLFGPGNMAPRLTCVSFAWREGDEIKTELLSHREGAREMMRLLSEAIAGKVTLALQNGPYDFAVLANEYPEALPLIFDAHEAGAIHDTMYAEQLIDIASGLLRMEFNEETGEYKSNKSYGLENLTRIHLWWPPYKDSWRLRYAELRDVPIKDYPEAAAIYPKKDAEGPLRVAEKQRKIAAGIAPHDPLVAMLAHVCRTYMALHLVAVWGEELDPERAVALEACMREFSAGFVPELEECGLVLRTMRGKNAGKLTKKLARLRELVAADAMERNVFESACVTVEDVLADPAGYLPEEMLTDGGKKGMPQIKCAADVLADCVDPRLKAMAGFLEAEKLRSSFGTPMLQFGRGPVHSRYGLAETGRTTCSGGGKRNRTGFNVQQMPRKMPKKLSALMRETIGEELDPRSCFVARPGWVQSSSDYNSLEMVTLAQACKWLVGYSTLGDALNEGLDPHTLFASDMLHCSYEDALARYKAEEPEAVAMRQRAKVGNFGAGGGIGAKKFCKYAKAQGVALALEESKRVLDLYRSRWKEMRGYFEIANDSLQGGTATMVGLASDLVRGGVGYTDWCNGNFQELAAYGATKAVWRVVRECYDARLKSALFGSRATAFIHDEVRAEHPIECGHEAAERLSEVMRDEMQQVCPDIIVRIEPCLTERWYKAAKTVRDENGRLQVWQPKEAT